MSNLGNLYFEVMLRDMTDADIEKLKKKLEHLGVKVGASVNKEELIKGIREALKQKSFSVDVDAKLKNKKIKIDIEANKQSLLDSVKQSLQGTSVKAHVDVNVDPSAITRAVQIAINNASFTYAPNGGGTSGSSTSSATRAQNNLATAYRNSANGAYESARATVTLGNSIRTNIRLAGELGTALGNFASVFGIKDLFANMVKIGGELENQRIALGAILQDRGKATEMFAKIQSLAVKSPFGIMDLNQYTKQLSAYGIEYNELYDTMKRMADISAGVGVDMGRIILAFGQVKAAGFLKGTELRQFTEANIPMVEKLAERFSMLEKRIVSAGEVYDMISKKKIAFEDVKAVLWDLTSEGGMFSGVQEVLSESLASKWKNLSDAIDVMYGKMADGMIGDALKWTAELLTDLTTKWQYLTTVVGSSIATYTAYKIAVATTVGSQAKSAISAMNSNHKLVASNLRVAQAYRELTAEEKLVLNSRNALNTAELKAAANAGILNKELTLRLVATKKITVEQARELATTLELTEAEITRAAATKRGAIAIGLLKNAYYGLASAMKAVLVNPFTWVFAGTTALFEWYSHYKQKQDEIKQRNEDLLQSARGSAETLEKELQKMEGINVSKLNADEVKIKVRELTDVIMDEAYGWQTILSDVFAREADGTFVNSAMEQLKLLQDKIEEIAKAKKALAENNDIYSEANKATETGFLWWDKDIIDSVKKYGEAISENDKKLKDLSLHARDVYNAISEASEGNKELQESLKGKSLVDQISLLRDYEDAWIKFTTSLDRNNQKAFDIVDSWAKNFTAKNAYGVWSAETVLLHKFRQAKGAIMNSLALNGEDMDNLSESARQTILGYVELLIREGGIHSKKLQQFFYDWWTENADIDYVDLGYIVPPQIKGNGRKNEYKESEDEVAKLWKRRTEEIEKAVKMYDQWKKVEGSAKARERVKGNEELTSLFNGAYGFNLDLEDPTKAYEYIQSKLNEKLSAQKKLMIELGVKVSDAQLKDAQDKLKSGLEQMKKETDKIVEGWNLYEDMFKATGNKEVSMNIAFGGNVSFSNKLENLKGEIQKKMKELGVGISFDDLIKMDTKQLEEEGFQELSGIIETYNKETAKVKEESVKNFIDIVKNSKDFAQQIADVERKLQKDLEDLRANSSKYTPEQVSRMETKLREEADKSIVKIQFAEFKESSNWVKVFDDLDRVSSGTLDMMIKKVEEFAKQAHLSEEVTKQLVEAMRKLREEAIDRNPFEGFKYAKEDLNRLKDAIKGKDANGKAVYMVRQADGSMKQMSQQEYDDAYKEVNDTITESILSIADKFDAVAQAADMVGGMFEALGVDMDGFLGTLSSVLTGTASGAKTGSNIAQALGIGGAWGAAAGAAIGAVTSIAQAHDKKLDAAINKSKEEVKKLSNAYKNLEGILEWQLGGATSKQVDELRKNLEKQRNELYEQRRLEEEKKNTDDTKIEDYNQQIHEAEIAIRDFYANLAEEQYGFNIKNWASDIANALTDAFASGEDAAKAFDNTVGGILKSLATEAIRMQFIEPAMENLRGFLFDEKSGIFAENSLGGTQMTDIEAGRLAEELGKLKGQIEESNEFWDKINEATGGLLDETEKQSGGLSSEIKGVSEDTAQLLASYLNSTRQDVSANRTLLEQLIGSDVPKMNYLAEAQLQQLQMVVDNTRRNADTADKIYDLVNRVVDKGANKIKI